LLHDLVEISAVMGSEASSFDGNGSVHQNDFMRGKIDDVRIYSRSLSDEEISALYLREKP